MSEKKIYESCKRLLEVCANAQKDEKILIVTDEDCLEIGMAIWDAAEDYHNKSLVMMETRKMHGEEPTDLVAAAMMEADVIFRATKFSLSHSMARRRACENGARDLNCCDYDFKMLESGGLYNDFLGESKRLVDQIAKGFAGDNKDCPGYAAADQVHVTSPLGTDYYCSIKGHKIFAQYGVVRNPGETCSPPDVECAVGAIPGTAHGKLVIDGSITHPYIEKLKQPIVVYIENSFCTKITGLVDGVEQDTEESKLFEKALAEGDLLKGDTPGMYRIGELACGLNPAASLCGRMLEDEGCYGYMHCAFGNNETDNQDFILHIDMMFGNATMTVDGKTIWKDGRVVFDD